MQHPEARASSVQLRARACFLQGCSHAHSAPSQRSTERSNRRPLSSPSSAYDLLRRKTIRFQIATATQRREPAWNVERTRPYGIGRAHQDPGEGVNGISLTALPTKPGWGDAPSVVIAFCAYRIAMFNRMPLVRPTTLGPLSLPFLKDGKTALASAFSRTQTFFLRLLPDDIDWLPIGKSETGAGPGRTACTQKAQQQKRTVFIRHTHLDAA